MKKILAVIFILILNSFFLNVFAIEEVKIQGRGEALLTGYDIGSVRKQQDKKMDKKAKDSNFEVLQTQQIKEATRQAETRKKQDKRLDNAVRTQVVTEARENALSNAIKTLINRTYGANAAENPQIKEKFDEIISQSSVFIRDTEYAGEVKDNKYIATVVLTVDEKEFRTLVSDLGAAITMQAAKAHSVMLVLDEFFAAPSNLNQNTATKEKITYKYDKDERDTNKEAFKAASSVNAASSTKAASAGYYGKAGYSSKAGVSAKSGVSYGKFNDYSNKESAFFEYVKEYAPQNPKASNLNYTEKALQKAFGEYKLNTIDNDIFRSKYFGDKHVTADILSKSAELSKYVDAAQKDGKADFIAIGVSYIIDNGKNTNTGLYTCDGQVDIKVYSTVDGKSIAAGSITDTAAGNSPDQARVAVANKIGRELGDNISRMIQTYWKDRTMYGNEYVVQIKGNFIPVERAQISSALKNGGNIQNVTLRSSNSSMIEYNVNYSGSDIASDAIFMILYESNLGNKFQNYDVSTSGNTIIFSPLKKGVPNL